MKTTPSKNNRQNFRTPHFKALFSFYGLAALFIAVLGILFFAIYKDLKFVNLRLGVCSTAGNSHIYHQITLLILVIIVGMISYLFIRLLGKQHFTAVQLGKEIARLMTDPPTKLNYLLEQLDFHKHTTYINSETPMAFTYGFFQAKIVLSRGLLVVLDKAELEAVLLHEQYHLQRLDPLKMIISRSIKASLFFLPLVKKLYCSYEQHKELAADQAAISKIQDKRILASAMLKVLSNSSSNSRSVSVLLAKPSNITDLRIAQLLSGNQESSPIAPPIQVVGTLILLSVLLVSFGTGCL